MTRCNVIIAALVSGIVAHAHADVPGEGKLPGFEISPHWGEQVKTFDLGGDVHIHINAPSVEALKAGRPVRVLVFALPNGNSTAWTIGKKMAAGDDWHFDIQHIGAQVRRVREVVTDYSLVVAYLEAEGRSWPKWRREHAGKGPKAVEIIEAVRAALPYKDVPVDIASHSGGGALVFALIDEADALPAWLGRIVLLDSDYAYDDASPQAEKLLTWLKGDAARRLDVIAYDDRNVQVDGKNVVGPNGGTYRRTSEMLERFRKATEFTDRQDGPVGVHRGLAGQIEIILLENPENKILHTVLVEKNGLIHGLTFGTAWENKAGTFWQERAYSAWIQPN